MEKKMCFLVYVSGFVCFRETVMLVVPQNVTEKYQSEMLLGASKAPG